jgi:hypothetical protein
MLNTGVLQTMGVGLARTWSCRALLKCGDPGDVGVAHQVFNEMDDGDMVSWNFMVSVYMHGQRTQSSSGVAVAWP